MVICNLHKCNFLQPQSLQLCPPARPVLYSHLSSDEDAGKDGGGCCASSDQAVQCELRTMCCGIHCELRDMCCDVHQAYMAEAMHSMEEISEMVATTVAGWCNQRGNGIQQFICVGVCPGPR